MIIQDDRTPADKETHTVLWGETDAFLSRWAESDNLTDRYPSYAFWACHPEHSHAVSAVGTQPRRHQTSQTD